MESNDGLISLSFTLLQTKIPLILNDLPWNYSTYSSMVE